MFGFEKTPNSRWPNVQSWPPFMFYMHRIEIDILADLNVACPHIKMWVWTFVVYLPSAWFPICNLPKNRWRKDAEMSISSGWVGPASRTKAWALWSAHEAPGAFGRHCMATGNWHLEAEVGGTNLCKTKVLNKVFIRVTHVEGWMSVWSMVSLGFSTQGAIKEACKILEISYKDKKLSSLGVGSLFQRWV